jgi:serine protease
LVYGQYHLQTLSLPGAWAAAGGWGLVGVLDNGVDAEHPELRSSSSAQSVGGTRIPGGNFLPYFSRNVGGRSQPPDLLDELQPSWFVHAYEIECDDDDGAVDGKLNMSLAGHGTHVAGLIAANGNDLAGVQGTCRNCGIAAVKRTATFCSLETPHTLRLGNTPDVDAEGIEHLYKSGAQVINMSFSNNETDCQAASNNRLCGALSTAWKHDLLMVASAGNARRNELWFPARDPRVASIGGIDSGGNFWDESPGDFSKCPFSGDSECGSNAASDTGAFTKARQELVAPAKNVRSTFYRGALWNPVIGCGDGYPADDSANSDGFGFCTGTSMSAPIVAGLYGLLRSINPLMRAGDPVNQATPLAPDGVRDIVAKTASRSQAGQPEDRKLGFGIPNAGAAVAAMLGVVRGKPVKNRATPLFGLHSNGGRDHAAVSTPQLAMALALYSTNAYAGTGKAIAGYPSFPNSQAGPPLARAFILTTEGPHYEPGMPAPAALHLLEKIRPGALPCDVADPRCHGDFILLTSAAQIDAAVAAGYRYGGLQGYVYGVCNPEPACRPAGTEGLHLMCNPQVSDCAAFLETDQAAFTAAGYTESFAVGTNSLLGYAYPVADADGDALVDAMEYVIGTSPVDSDSDDDGIVDGIEYPLDAAPVSDPCLGPNVTCLRGYNDVFEDGFE